MKPVPVCCEAAKLGGRDVGERSTKEFTESDGSTIVRVKRTEEAARELRETRRLQHGVVEELFDGCLAACILVNLEEEPGDGLHLLPRHWTESEREPV